MALNLTQARALQKPFDVTIADGKASRRLMPKQPFDSPPKALIRRIEAVVDDYNATTQLGHARQKFYLLLQRKMHQDSGAQRAGIRIRALRQVLGVGHFTREPLAKALKPLPGTCSISPEMSIP